MPQSTNIEYLNSFIDETISNLSQVRINGVKKELSFTINCRDLEDFNYKDIRQSEKFKSIFEQLKDACGPTLYWFEIISATTSKDIINALSEYKVSSDSKATPALRSKIDFDSRTLYVGKVKGSFWGRLITHLGFLKVNKTQGLQLYYWTKSLPLELKVHLLEFEDNMANIMPIIEYAFARQLNPLAGKHT